MGKRLRRSRAIKGRPREPEHPLPKRLLPGQYHMVTKVNSLRSEASELRAHISEGRCGARELESFLNVTRRAPGILRVSSAELGERSQLGEGFFPILRTEKPKLENILRALTAIIKLADERLYDIDRDRIALGTISSATKIERRIQQDHADLLRLARSLSQLALDEIEVLDAERPNDPDRIAAYKRHRELLQIFANAFARIERALSVLGADSAEPAPSAKAAKVVESVGKAITKWWVKNEQEAIDWTVRIPVFAAGVAALGWAGANMTVGTTAMAAMVGGKTVIKAIGKRASKGRRKNQKQD